MSNDAPTRKAGCPQPGTEGAADAPRTSVLYALAQLEEDLFAQLGPRLPKTPPTPPPPSPSIA